MIQQTPVLIYQMGKVGSTTMMAALEAARIPNIHVHFLSRQHLDEIEKHYQNLPHAQIPQHICRSKQIMSAIEDTRGKIRWKVITLVREPIARMISDVFQNITDRMPQINHAGEDEACRIISDDILNSLENFEEKTDYLCTWYDKEIKVVFEFDVYSWPFNKSEGYQIYEARNADILLIKLEKLSGCYRQALDDFISLTDIVLSDANAAISKPYRRLYKQVKENIAIPESCLERIYSTRFVQQFYTAEEIDRFKKKWRQFPPTQREPKFNDAGPPASLFAVSSLGNHSQRQARQTNGAGSVTGNRASSFSNAAQTADLPVISVITPSFNQAQYLEECIDSVLSQSYPNLEYIIMDGGSTDNSMAIIKKYEKYLTYWQSRPDGGQYAAVNEGFLKSSGSIMTWLNSDDKYHPDAFITVAALFQSRNDVEWITGRSNTFYENGTQKWICEYLLPYSRSNYLKRKFDAPWIQQEGTFWRRCLWEKSGATLRTELELAGDLELWTRFFRFSRLYVIDALIAGYRYQPQSKARLYMDKYLKEADNIIDNEIKLFSNSADQTLLTAPELIGNSEIRKALDNLLNGGGRNDASRSGAKHSFIGGFPLAVKFYDRSIESDPDNFKARNSLGMLYWQCGEINKSIKQFINALKIAPDYPAAALNLGDALANIGFPNLKTKLYASYLSDYPQFKALFKKLANFEMDEQEKRFQ